MKNRILKLIIADIFASGLGLYFSFLLRFEFLIPKEHAQVFFKWIPLFIFAQVVVFYLSGLYARIWRYTSFFDLLAILRASTISCGISFMGVLFLMGYAGYPRSVLVLYYIFNIIFASSIRLSVRVYFSHFHENSVFKMSDKKKILLVGAGKTGEKISRETLSDPSSQYKVVGFVDDDPNKLGGMLHGLKIFCNINDLPSLKIPYDEILITAPAATGQQIRRIVDICKQTGKRYRTVPGLNELMDVDVTIELARDVSYMDLLGREEVKLDLNSIEKLLKGKRVLISGAGGSIGSELIKQCLTFEPAEIICLDCSEEKIFDIMAIGNMMNVNTIIKPVLGNINHKNQMEKVFNENRPQIVFHAAAYKHVPIQEIHPWTAVSTNVGGTLRMLELADKYSAEKFVLVSTDKAVNPVNVMGATKRLAEILTQSINTKSDTEFLAVRFGNVMGSSGSAIPIFEKQIKNGGPVTVTHPEMTRYFMSTKEASQLILQSGAIGNGGEIILLEMGNPIKIDQLARDLIKLSGLEPETDIPVVYTGLRPGEKLYEELQSLDEKLISTSHKKVMILKDGNQTLLWEELKSKTLELVKASEELETDKIQIKLKEILPRYAPRTFYSITSDESLDSFNFTGEA